MRPNRAPKSVLWITCTFVRILSCVFQVFSDSSVDGRASFWRQASRSSTTSAQRGETAALACRLESRCAPLHCELTTATNSLDFPWISMRRVFALAPPDSIQLLWMLWQGTQHLAPTFRNGGGQVKALRRLPLRASLPPLMQQGSRRYMALTLHGSLPSALIKLFVTYSLTDA
jgi:hypothetical protein